MPGDRAAPARSARRTSAAGTRPRTASRARRPAAESAQALEDPALFRALFDNAGIGMALMDAAGRIVRCNPALAGMLGHDEAALRGRPLTAYVHPDEAGAAAQRGRRSAPEGGDRARASTRYLHSSGRTIWARLTLCAAPRRHAEAALTIALLEDMTRQEETTRSLQAAHQRLKALSARILDAQESERRLIALELHDEIGQALSALKINLHDLRRSTRDDRELRFLQSAMNITELAFGHIRKLSVRLRPPQLDIMGLEVALRSHLEQRTAEAGLTLELDCRLGAARRGPRIDITCFRLVQEALTNIIRHAQAATVGVRIVESEGTIALTIQDDGIGFDVEEAKARSLQTSSMGLAGMEERVHLLNGSFEIVSSPGAGTEIRARLLPSILERERRQRAR